MLIILTTKKKKIKLFILMNSKLNINNEELSDIENYFLPRSQDEDMPIKIDKKDALKYYKLEKIFNSFFKEDSLSTAKDKSREEREKKGIKDSSFVYGEIV